MPAHIASLPPYVPGKPIETVEKEYGLLRAVKLASNENPLGPSPFAVNAVQQALSSVHRYPDGSGKALIDALSSALHLPADRFILGNGSDEIIALLTRAFLGPNDRAVMPKPAFLMYEITVRSVNAVPVDVPLKDLNVDLEAMRDRIDADTRMVFLNNPHNPTGSFIPKREFERFLARIPSGVIVVVDEAYIEYVRDPDCLDSLNCAGEESPVVTLRTFSKAYGLAGLRIGYGVMPSEMAAILNRIRAPFNTNSLAQVAAIAALKDPGFVEKTVTLVHRELDFLFRAIGDLGLTVFPTQANYFLIDVRQSADALFQRLLAEGVIVRSMTAYGYPEYIRVSVGLHEENVRLVEALKRCV
ncbi:MAG: histidinol-phosphate transaminase [Deltaproteobacteria bacterium]|nr:histidinol-phosphate transaminase [Deltaproteobacteria bacterium]MBW1954594.1 histidinol-phosphate transaminase [Deltaproteobacteria bacterium]MBW2042690.1 histidinol-phosphate transaminase [Deltaproteobacteria bacterium]MBW2131964.1 histidinol-phosphate transaminase [Deltaproteobacteria bacterium]